MGRIEDALAKIQASGQRPQERRALARMAERTDHVYGGVRIEIDLGELRRQGFIPPDSSGRQLEDQYRLIKRPLLANASTHVPPLVNGNLFMVTSAVANEGKTFTAINLCLSIARENDWKVVLADGDSAKAHLSRLFGVQQEPGLYELLTDSTKTLDSLVIPTNVPGFSVLSAGRGTERASELFASARMAQICDEAAADQTRILVFDSSPLLMTSDAVALAARVGQIVLVVRANHTLQHQVLEAVQRLDQSKAINLVLNQAAPGSVGATYGYYPSSPVPQ